MGGKRGRPRPFGKKRPENNLIPRNCLSRQYLEAAGEKNRTPTECISQKYLELSGILFIVLNVDQKVALINKKGCDLLGYGKKQIIGKNWFDNFLPERSRAGAKAAFRRLISGKAREVARFENPILTKKGEERLIAWTNSVLRSGDGRVISTISAGEDITRHRKAEEAVRESEEKYRTLVNQSLDGIIIAQGPVPRIVFANPALARMLGYTVKELLSLPPEKIMKLVHPDDREMFFGQFRDRLQGKPAPPFYEFRGLRKDGRVLWAASSSNRIMYGGQPAVQATFTDITRHRKAEEAVRESEEKYHTLVNQSLEGIIIAQGPVPRIAFANPALARMLGYTVKELLSLPTKKIMGLVHPNDREMFFGRFRDRLQGKPAPTYYEFRGLRKDKKEIWLAISSNRIIYKGQPAVQAAFTDITARKRGEKALKESEANFRALFETSGDPMFVHDFKGKILNANSAACEKLGYSKEELLSMNLREIDTPENEKLMDERMHSLIRKGRILFEGAHFTKEGKAFPVEVSARVGEYYGVPSVLSIARDITGRKKTEDALKESEEKFRTLVEGSQDLIMLTNADGTVSYLSPSCKKVLGWDPKSIIGTRPSIFHPEDGAKVGASLSSALRGKSGTDLQYRIVTKEGEVKWISHSWYPVMLHGKLRMVASIVHDITLRKKNEDALSKMNRTLKLLTESDRLLIKAEDEQGLLQGICDLIVEQGGYRMAWFGISIRDQNKSILPVAHAGFEEGFLKSTRFSWGENRWGCGPTGIAIRSGRPCFAGNIAKDPKYAPWRKEAVKRGYASFISLPLVFEGKSIGVLNIYSETLNAFNAEEIALLDELANDVAYGVIAKRADEEHRRVEEFKRDYTFKLESDVRSRTKDLLEQKRKAEALTEMKDRFIRDIGHELKTPLSVILGNLVLLKGIAPAGKEREWSKLLDMMDRSANRLDTSINKMLQLYKLTKAEAKRERVYLKEMLADLYNEYLPLAKMKELELRVESRPAVIIGDGELLQLALSNLVSNAIKFTDRGSVLVELKPSEKFVSISVSDTGKGLSRENRKRLFEKFFKVDPSAPGTGIGLTIAKEIVEKHKGELKVDSRLGEGSTFTMILPRGVQNG